MSFACVSVRSGLMVLNSTFRPHRRLLPRYAKRSDGLRENCDQQAGAQHDYRKRDNRIQMLECHTILLREMPVPR